MLDSIYIGMSGLTAYSKGLQTISNNVANMNTPGFRVSTPRFADLSYERPFNFRGTAARDQSFGSGVYYDQSLLDFRQGEISKGNGPLDLAIQGDGFIPVVDKGVVRYVRTAQFSLSKDGLLVDANTSAALAQRGPDSAFIAWSLADKRIDPPKATSVVQFSDNLSSGASEFSVPNVIVYDPQGKKHTLTIQFKPDKDSLRGGWKVTVEDADGKSLYQGDLAFVGGIPEPGSDVMSVTMPVNGASPFTFKLDFSNDVTSYSAGTFSSLRVAKSDGSAAGEIASMSVNEGGELMLGYSNGQTASAGSVTLAKFANPQQLMQLGRGLFDASHVDSIDYATSHQAGLGTLLSGSVEGSNVDLSVEFGRLILIQRGFQASSQVVSTANEMLMQLFQMRGQG